MEVRVVRRPAPGSTKESPVYEMRCLADGVLSDDLSRLPANLRARVESLLTTRNIHEDADGNGIPDHFQGEPLGDHRISVQTHSIWNATYADPRDVEMFDAPLGRFTPRAVPRSDDPFAAHQAMVDSMHQRVVDEARARSRAEARQSNLVMFVIFAIIVGYAVWRFWKG